MRWHHWLLLVGSALLGLGAGWVVPGGGGGERETALIADSADRSVAKAGARAVERGVLGERRPDFALPDLEGEPLPLSRFDGRILVINFWATWCPPCVEEIPMLIELQDDLAGEGVQVLGVAVEGPEPVREFADDFAIDYPLVADRREGFTVAAEYGNPQGLMPYTVFVDRRGVIRGVHQGLLSRAQAEQHLKALLDD